MVEAIRDAHHATGTVAPGAAHINTQGRGPRHRPTFKQHSGVLPDDHSSAAEQPHHLELLRHAYSRLDLTMKTVVPFVALFVSLAAIGTVVFGSWFLSSMEESMESRAEDVAALLQSRFDAEATHLSDQARFVADSEAVTRCLRGGDHEAVNKTLLPVKATLGLSYIRLIDAKGATVAEVREQSLSGKHFDDALLVRRAAAGLQLADVLSAREERKDLLVGIAPVTAAEGLVGSVILGKAIDDAFMQRIGAGTKDHLVALDLGAVAASSLPMARDQGWKLPSPGSPPQRVEMGGNEFIAKNIGLRIDDGDTDLSIVVLSDIAPMDLAARLALVRLAGFVLLGFVLTSLFGHSVVHYIARPLGKLTAASRKIASGDLTARSAIDTADEIGTLGRAFDTMAARLEADQRALYQALAQLEERHAELEYSHQQLRQLQEVTTTLTADVEPSLLLHRLADVLADLQAGASVWILTVGADGTRLQGGASVVDPQAPPTSLPELFGTTDKGAVSTTPADNILGRSVSCRRPEFIGDIGKLTDDERAAVFGRPTGTEGLGIHSLAVVPLLLEGEAIGVVVVGSKDPGKFTDDQQATLTVFANQAALSISNAQLFQEVKWLGEVDGLTKLYNQGSMPGLMRRELEQSRRAARPMAVMVIDVDNFKLFNDTYGHITGDLILQQVATALRVSCRDTDVLCRYGGDEFLAILPDTMGEQAEAVARRFLEQLARVCAGTAGRYDVPITCSVGVAIFPRDGVNKDDLVRVADAAMYDAKRSGGNTVRQAGAALEEMRTPKSSQWSMLDSLVTAVDNKDRYTRHHSESVTRYALGIATAMGVPATVRDQIMLAAPLHDLGKICVPDHILRKPGPLTNDERDVMEQHPTSGAMIVQQIPHLEDVLDAIRHHHERYDGTGYPQGLSGKKIPLVARMLAVADAYSAMTSDRPYRRSLSVEDALAELRGNAGTQFDPDVVESFIGWLQQDAAIPSLRHSTESHAMAEAG